MSPLSNRQIAQAHNRRTAVELAQANTWRVVKEIHGGYAIPWGCTGALQDPALDQFRWPTADRCAEASALRAAVAQAIRTERKEIFGR